MRKCACAHVHSHKNQEAAKSNAAFHRQSEAMEVKCEFSQEQERLVQNLCVFLVLYCLTLHASAASFGAFLWLLLQSCQVAIQLLLHHMAICIVLFRERMRLCVAVCLILSGRYCKNCYSFMGHMAIWAKKLGLALISMGRSGNWDQRDFYGGLII